MPAAQPEDAATRPAEQAAEPTPAPSPANAQAAAAPAANTYLLLGVKRLWSVVSALLLVVAATLGWLVLTGRRGLLDATFVVATLGILAWFLDVRNVLRARSIEAEAGHEAPEPETDKELVVRDEQTD